jgi:hypothetical protein
VLVEYADDAEETDGETEQDNNELHPHRVKGQTEDGDYETKQGYDDSDENHMGSLILRVFERLTLFESSYRNAKQNYGDEKEKNASALVESS